VQIAMVEETSVGPSDPLPKATLLAESTARIRTGVQAVVRPLSARARLAVSLGVLASVLLGIAVVLFLPSATLNVVCRHDFRSVELTVAVDGDVVLTETLTGSVKKWLGVVERTGGSYTRAVSVGSGKHVIQVRMRAPGYDSTRVIRGDFDRGKEYTLSVDSGRDLSLSLRSTGGEAVTAEGGRGGSWLSYGRSLLLTIFGSIVSATIGVYVQAFLHSRKRPLVGPTGGERERPPDRS
jgi:hypothetical protein